MAHPHYPGQWMLPGGAVETYDQSLAEACSREMKEETGLDIGASAWAQTGSRLEIQGATSWHLTYYTCRIRFAFQPEIQNLEPDKHQAWQWFEPGSLPEQIWRPDMDVIHDSIRPSQANRLADQIRSEMVAHAAAPDAAELVENFNRLLDMFEGPEKPTGP